jgi:hypothetical protein
LFGRVKKCTAGVVLRLRLRRFWWLREWQEQFEQGMSRERRLVTSKLGIAGRQLSWQDRGEQQLLPLESSRRSLVASYQAYCLVWISACTEVPAPADTAALPAAAAAAAVTAHAGNPKYVTGKGSRSKRHANEDVPHPTSIKERVERDRLLEAAEAGEGG